MITNKSGQCLVFFCRLLLKVKSVRWGRYSSEIDWDTFCFNILLFYLCELALNLWKSDSGFRVCVFFVFLKQRKQPSSSFMFLCCGGESVIVHETEGRTTGERAGGDE